MELSPTNLTGLEAAASSTITDNAYTRLVAAVFQCALGLADQSVVEGKITCISIVRSVTCIQ